MSHRVKDKKPEVRTYFDKVRDFMFDINAKPVMAKFHYMGHDPQNSDMDETKDSAFLKKMLEVMSWQTQAECLRSARVFHFDDDISMLMSMTDGEDEPLRLPYPITFLDINIPHHDMEGNQEVADDEKVKYIGMLLCESSGYVKLQDIGWVSRAHETKAQLRRRMGNSIVEELDYPHIIAFIYSSIDNIEPVTNFVYILDMEWGENEDYSMTDAQAKEIIESVLDSNFTDFRMEGSGLLEAIEMAKKLTSNFIQLLDTHEVILSPMISESKGKKKGTPISKAPHTKVQLSLPLRQYMRKVKDYELAHGKFPKAHWVRGHFKHWKAERYTNMRGKRTYVSPYIRGLGEPMNKPYLVESRSTTNTPEVAEQGREPIDH
jgi:hypothetical protein